MIAGFAFNNKDLESTGKINNKKLHPKGGVLN